MENSTKIRIHEPSQVGILVELSGEFDVQARRALGKTLNSAASWGSPVRVDLSGVTFMDSACLWELVVEYWLYRENLALCNPSPQVELGVAACGLEGWIVFRPSEETASRTADGLPPKPREKSTEAAESTAGKTLLDTRKARKRRATDVAYRRRGPQG
ncbi:STAS domain-containing protein [Rubrobacter marinus]|uniref:STAS domain-containing protein n=1 Tax=Rubrobacter marinus TaxID=2653852 RepID=UPI001407D4CB|nr:STAS domain-containing protein [Rubrobacter marinus]